MTLWVRNSAEGIDVHKTVFRESTSLAAAKPRTAVPGHGDIDGTQVLEDVLGYLRSYAMRPGRTVTRRWVRRRSSRRSERC
jgi:hypothetical protein